MDELSRAGSDRQWAAAGSKWVGFTADTKQIQKQIDELTKGQQGRKVVREASKAALQIFNKETAENATKLNLKPSGKGWRKMLKKDSSYKYKASAKNTGTFSAVTGINYKKAVLRISHLVERGFQHFKAGKVSGNWFRMNAFKDNRDKFYDLFSSHMQWGMEQVIKTGKAPSASKMRKRTIQ
jgi:hypothetical protein